MHEPAELEPSSAGLLTRGIGSALERLGPLSAGAVVSSLALVSGGRLLRRLLGAGPSRKLGWSAAAALLTLGLWLLAGPGEADEAMPESGDPPAGERAAEDES